MRLADVARILGTDLPDPPGKCFCPFTDHRREDKTFRVYKSKSGDDMWKCWSCDEPNSGDAVAFFARMSGCDRATAWNQLKDAGLVTGNEIIQRQRPPAKKETEIPFRGTHTGKVLPLDVKKWNSWQQNRFGNVEKFAEMRSLDALGMRMHGVVDMPGSCIGFTYFDPDSGAPCRVKVRGVDQKKFFVEPFIKGSDARALGPLYLANELRDIGVTIRPVIIVEGEVDALSMLHLGFSNVVSLPDGAESAKTVDLSPIYPRYNVWLVPLDYEDPLDPKWKGKTPPGLAGYKVLRERAKKLNVDVIWIEWTMFDGDEPVTYKDANEAMMAGNGKRQFEICLDLAMKSRFGYTVDW